MVWHVRLLLESTHMVSEDDTARTHHRHARSPHAIWRVLRRVAETRCALSARR